MEIRRDDIGSVFLNMETNFKPDLGREESLQLFETETIRSIINPIDNYETVRFIHKPYSGITSNTTDTQSDIWFQFYFYNGSTHTGGLDYSLVGIDNMTNAKQLRQTTKTFFKLEFFIVPDGQQPDRTNRKLVFSKTLTMPLGEKVFYTPFADYIHVPIFSGSNYRNKENMYLFWFQNTDSFEGTYLTGTTFYMTARFFNGTDGSIINFSNTPKSKTTSINESNDLYYKVIIDRSNYSYEVFTYTGTTGSRIGKSGNPIKFYEVESGG